MPARPPPPYAAPSSTSSAALTKQRDRAETTLRRQIMGAFWSEPDVFVMCNEANTFTRMLNFIAKEDRAMVWRTILEEERYGLGIGSPDLVFVVAGIFLGLEVKRPACGEQPAGDLSDSQIEWRKNAEAKGVMYRRVRSIEEAREAVAEARQKAGGGR